MISIKITYFCFVSGSHVSSNLKQIPSEDYNSHVKQILSGAMNIRNKNLTFLLFERFRIRINLNKIQTNKIGVQCSSIDKIMSKLKKKNSKAKQQFAYEIKNEFPAVKDKKKNIFVSLNAFARIVYAHHHDQITDFI